MRGTSRCVIPTGTVLIWLAIATVLPLPAQSQIYLKHASLGQGNAITLTIPKSGLTNFTHSFTLWYEGRHGRHVGRQTCATGALTDSWALTDRAPHDRHPPYGLTLGFNRTPMTIPSGRSREISFHVLSTASPATLRWTILVPKGTCEGWDQLRTTVTVTLVKAP